VRVRTSMQGGEFKAAVRWRVLGWAHNSQQCDSLACPAFSDMALELDTGHGGSIHTVQIKYCRTAQPALPKSLLLNGSQHH
jgi:hypothetical protein